MPVTSPPLNPYPQYWTIWGHSYYNASLGTVTGQGRIDAYLRRMMNITQGVNWQNHATVGARITQGLNSAGGFSAGGFATDSAWGRILQLVNGQPAPLQLGSQAPYLTRGVGNSGGAFLIGYGANDLGYNGNTPLWNTIYANTVVAMVSRMRMSALGNMAGNNYPGGAGTSAFGGGAGAGYAPQSTAVCTGRGLVSLTGLNSAWTITLPADYNGEVVTLLFVQPPGGAGNVITFSGTAGVTGTVNTAAGSSPQPSANWAPVAYRIKTLTSANAGQTIIATQTTVDTAGTTTYCDSWWLEADNPPPVVVVNMMRCLTAALAYPPFTVVNGYNAWVATFTAGNIIAATTLVSACPATVALTAQFLCGTTGGLGTLAPIGVPSAGSFKMPCTSGTATITYTGITPGFTGATVAAGSNGGTISGIAAWATPGAGTLAIGGLTAAQVTTLPSAGFATVATSTTLATIAYTGVTATTLTGCTYVGGSAAGTVATGGAVSFPGMFTGCTATAGTGTFTSQTITTPGPSDADVATFNAALPAALAGFDSMVQLADIDSSCGKIPALYSFDGLHLNELGASKAASTIMGAIQRMVPTSPFDAASDLNPPAQHLVPLVIPRIGGDPMNSGWVVTATSATPCVFSLPFNFSLPNGTMVRLASTGTLPTGFSALLDYFVVVSSSNTFELALTPGGGGVASSSTGTGTIQVYVTGKWYAPDGAGTLSASAYTPVLGDTFALPFFVSGGVVTTTAWGMQTTGAGTASSVFAAIFDDHQYAGYPQYLVDGFPNFTGSALAMPATATTNFVSTATPGATGYFNWVMEPGLWWFVVKFAVAGTATFAQWTGPSQFMPQLSANGLAPAAASAPCAWKLATGNANMMNGRFPIGALPVGPAPLVSIKVQ